MDDLRFQFGNDVNIDNLADFIITNLPFKKVLELYLILKEEFDKPSITSISRTYKIKED